MKTILFIALSLIISVSAFSKTIVIKSKDIKHFETVNNKRYFIVMKNGKKIELYNHAQKEAIIYLHFIYEKIEVHAK